MRNKKPLGIYLHIPFCVRKCNYCDFLSAPAQEETRRRYVQCLTEEIRQFEAAKEYEVKSVFFGGGTPSILEGKWIAALMEELEKIFSFSEIPEITIECNPGTLTAEKLDHYRKSGINRLSLGLQSADENELKLLGRIHTWEDFYKNYQQARESGFENISVDLMSALPGQTVSSWKRTLEKVLALKPEHISAYSLIIEEGTPFYDWYGAEDEKRRRGLADNGRTVLPSEEEEREMYYDTKRFLTEAGYQISNYAVPGYESIHNSGYWLRREYVGFGLGASSQVKNLRCKNTERLEDYLKSDFFKKEVQILTRQEEIEETMYLGLRMMQGVNLQGFQKSFGVRVETLYKETLEKLERQGLLRIKDGCLRLTDSGIDVSNAVMAEFLL